MLRILNQESVEGLPLRTPGLGEAVVSVSSRGWAMDKKLCLGSLGVAALMLLLFLIDIIIGIPFGGKGPFVAIDIIGIIASGILLYMSIHAYREVR